MGLEGVLIKSAELRFDLICFLTCCRKEFRVQSKRSTVTGGCREDTPHTWCFPWLRTQVCVARKNTTSHRHVIHVYTCAFFIILLHAYCTIDTHCLFLVYFIEDQPPRLRCRIRTPQPRSQETRTMAPWPKYHLPHGRSPMWPTLLMSSRLSLHSSRARTSKPSTTLATTMRSLPMLRLTTSTSDMRFALPLFSQEAEAEASLQQTYHSNEGGLFKGAQSILASTGQPVVWLTQKRKSSQELDDDQIRILLARQQEQLLAEAKSDILRHEYKADLAEKTFVHWIDK